MVSETHLRAVACDRITQGISVQSKWNAEHADGQGMHHRRPGSLEDVGERIAQCTGGAGGLQRV